MHMHTTSAVITTFPGMGLKANFGQMTLTYATTT